MEFFEKPVFRGEDHRQENRYSPQQMVGKSIADSSHRFGCTQNSQESPRQTKPKKGANEKFMNFAHFCEFWCFSLGKQARFTLNFCSGMPCEKFMNWPFFALVCRGDS